MGTNKLWFHGHYEPLCNFHPNSISHVCQLDSQRVAIGEKTNFKGLAKSVRLNPLKLNQIFVSPIYTSIF